MKHVKRLTIAIAILLGSYLIALLWWRAWMYQGFEGPIPFLHWFISSDGEQSYNLTELEMYIHVLIFVFLSYIFYKSKYTKQFF